MQNNSLFGWVLCHRNLETKQHSFHTCPFCASICVCTSLWRASFAYPHPLHIKLCLVQESVLYTRAKNGRVLVVLTWNMHLAKFIIKWSSLIVHHRPATFSGTRCCSILLNLPSLQILIIFLNVFSVIKIIIIKRKGFLCMTSYQY